MGLHLFRKTTKEVGDAPGTIVYVGDVKDAEVKLNLTKYDISNISEKRITEDELSSISDISGVKWFNVIGIHNTELLENIGQSFNIHPLILEDIANTSQQPKIEEYSDLIFAVLKMFYVNSHNEITMEPISLILKKDLVISFQEVEGDVFDPVRKRLKDGRKKLRSSGADYLFYALIDAVIDNYFTVLHKFGEKLDELKKAITINPNQKDLVIIDKLQEEILVIQNSVSPLQDMVPELKEYETASISESNWVYFQDLHDHISQILLTVNAIKDKLSSMHDYYIAVVSNKTNEVMKTLALVATICVPLTVIAGVYGMNFQYMQELSSPIAYPVVLSIMATTGISLFAFFKKKKWV